MAMLFIPERGAVVFRLSGLSGTFRNVSPFYFRGGNNEQTFLHSLI